MSTDKLPQNYDDLEKALKELFEDWEEELKKKLLKERLEKELKGRVDKELEEKIAKELEEKIAKEFKFVEDGAFPGYFNQPLKILFVGREAYGCEGSCDPDSETYRKCKYKDNQSFKCTERKLMQFFLADKPDPKDPNHPKRPRAAQRAAKITYGLQKQIPEWQKIPNYPDGVSFAFMDVSKYANPKGPKPSGDFLKYVEASLGANESKRNFIREEIDILDPHLIISWNLAREPGVDFLKRLTGDPKPTGSKPVSIWTYKGKREIPLLNTYHFSAPVSPKRDIYIPLRNAVKKLIAERKDKDKAWSELSKVWSQS